MTNLHDALDADLPESWTPMPGEKIVGELVSVGSRESYYGPYPIVVVRDASGKEWAIHAFRQVLQSELVRARPRVGDQIGVKYEGQREDESYHRYRVLVDRPPGAEVDWSQYDPEAASTAPAPPPLSAVTAPTAAGAPTASAAPATSPQGDKDIPF